MQNVGSNKTVSINTLALADGSNGGLAANYTLTGGTHQLTVNQSPISFTGTREYDGSQTVGNSVVTLTGLQGGENLSITGSGTVVSANVGNGKSVNVSGFNLENGSGGTAGLASNYTFSGGTQTFNITEKPVNITGTRTYNAGTVVASGTLTVNDEVGSEQLAITGNGSISDKNVGTGKTINTTGLSLQNGSGGALAANYTLTGGTHTYIITQAPISFSGTRAYNATTNVEALILL